MGTPSAALYSTRYPLGCSFSPKLSARHFNKQLVGTRNSLNFLQSKVKLSTLPPLESRSASSRRAHLLKPIKCAFTENPSSKSQTPELLLKFRSLSFGSMKEGLSQLTPFDVCKLLGVAAIAIGAAKWTFNLVFNPFFLDVFQLDMALLALVCGNWTWVLWYLLFSKALSW